MSFAARIERGRASMAEAGADALLLSVGPDLPYFMGYRAPQLERLTMGVITPTDAFLVAPRLEAMKIAADPAFEVVAWGETDDPVALVAGRLGDARELAIGDHTWARFLIEFQMAVPTGRFRRASGITAPLRVCKDEQELDSLAAAAAAADAVAGHLADFHFSGQSEREVAALVRDLCLSEGHDEAWDPIVASGPNGASPHHGAGQRIIGKGDSVVVDFGGTVDGYFADTTRTFVVGEPQADVAAAYEVLHRAQAAAVAAVAPGVPAQDVDSAARDIIDDAGYGDRLIHRTGHGIGLDIHEDPYIVSGNSTPLTVGMTFSVEPGIYTAGQWGMRIEDIVAVSADGVRVLNQSSRDLVVVA